MTDSATQLFLRARALSAEARTAFLARACGADLELRREVESLLEHDALAQDWIPDDAPRQILAEVAASALAADRPPEIPRRLGKYPILGVVGRGGMGIVYRSEQDNPRRPVALKVLRSELLDDAIRLRFQQEIEILGRLRHPSIAQIYEAGTCDTELGRMPYLAMELVDGSPLLERARDSSVSEKLEWIAAVAEAVQHAHSKGIVHRDLKPSNLLIDLSGQVKVLDFGVARIGGERTTMTISGQLVGTLPYMSPEQLAGREDIDARTDVYSLGVCLYQLLAGRLPLDIDGRPLTEAIRYLEEHEPTRLGLLAPECAGDLEAIVHKALAKERERRYSGAMQLAEDIRRYLRNEPILARPPSHLYVLARMVRRHRVVVAASLIVGLALLAASLATRTQQRQSDRLRLLSAVQRLRGLREEAVGLWPHVPHRLPAHQAWIAEAEELAAELPEWKRELATVSEDGLANAEGRRTTRTGDQQELHDERTEFVADLTEFADPDQGRGLLADVRARQHQIEDLLVTAAGEHRAEWDQCLAAVDSSPRYPGVPLEVQAGLVPLREDPESGLWEFLLEGSGDRPTVDPAGGRWQIVPRTGIVMVLLPGGTFRMGAQNRSPDLPNWSYDLRNDETPVHEVRVEPFFLSKYELTQAQWERLTGNRPSEWPPESDPSKGVHPVERISWEECLKTVGLPSEAQWEYAARAGTDTTWFGGNAFDDLVHFGNIKDQSYLRTAVEFDVVAPWDDNYAKHAPVGSFEPNAFGLHDMLGNVWEWCFDTYGSYELPTREHNAVRVVLEPEQDHRVFRGGCYDSNHTWTNSSARNHRATDYRRASLGVRPALMLRQL